LTRKQGSGILGGTLTGVIAVGQSSVTISGVTYNGSDPLVSLLASGTGDGSLVDGKVGDSNSFAVTGAAQLRFEPIANQVSGVPFGVTVTLVDDTGNPVANVGSTGTVTLSAIAASGGLSGTVTAEIPVGEQAATFTGVVFTTASATSVILIASGSGAGSLVDGKAGDSAAFTVSAVGPGPGPAPGPGPVPEPQPTAPPPPAPTLDPVGLDLPPGQDRVTVGNRPVPVNVRANVTNNGLEITGPGFGMQLACLGRAVDPVPLGADGVLRLIPGRTFQVCGTGYRAQSPVRVFLMYRGTPQLLGVLASDADGAFTGTVPIPSDTRLGVHSVQVNGYTPGSEVRRFSLGLNVVDADRVTETVGSRLTFATGSAKLTTQTKRSLRALLRQIPEDATTVTVVEGIVRRKNATPAERALARQRATRVARFLRAEGLAEPIRVAVRAVRVTAPVQRRQVVVTIDTTAESN
jgi:outer membrane protein OmpA-like peptidoglycan-associated protein